MKRTLRTLIVAVWPLLLAAGPTEPLTARLGDSLTLRLPLPTGATIVGYPDLSPFALRAAPTTVGEELILELVPLRPGHHQFPALPLLDTRNRPQQTSPMKIDVTAPEAPAALQPLKAWPTPNATGPQTQPWPGFALIAAVAVAAWMFFRRRRPPPVQPPARLDTLARRLVERTDHDAPRWQPFKDRLQRLRFAPLPASDEQIGALEQLYESLCREEPR